MESGDDNEDEEEERGNGLSAFMFGNVGKDMQLEEDYMDEVWQHELRKMLLVGGDLCTHRFYVLGSCQ